MDKNIVYKIGLISDISRDKTISLLPTPLMQINPSCNTTGEDFNELVTTTPKSFSVSVVSLQYTAPTILHAHSRDLLSANVFCWIRPSLPFITFAISVILVPFSDVIAFSQKQSCLMKVLYCQLHFVISHLDKS